MRFLRLLGQMFRRPPTLSEVLFPHLQDTVEFDPIVWEGSD